MNYCETCKWRDSHGFCGNEEKLMEGPRYVKEEKEDCLIYSYYEGGSFWVGPRFGCVHHTKIEKNGERDI